MFKKGDRVVCIDDSRSVGLLEAGAVYTATGVDSGLFLTFDGGAARWSYQRFRLARWDEVAPERESAAKKGAMAAIAPRDGEQAYRSAVEAAWIPKSAPKVTALPSLAETKVPRGVAMARAAVRDVQGARGRLRLGQRRMLFDSRVVAMFDDVIQKARDLEDELDTVAELTTTNKGRE